MAIETLPERFDPDAPALRRLRSSLLYGLAVTGTVHPERVWRAAARACGRWARWRGGLDSCLTRSLVAGALALLMGNVAEAIAIFAVILINAAIGFLTEWRAIRSMEALRRLEYRGYDSAGIAIRNGAANLQRIRSVGKVAELQSLLDQSTVDGPLGIAHTRWATHGMPAERNAHPHMSGENVAIVHNGIIENHAELRADLQQQGYTFSSETDTEVIAHLLAALLGEGQSTSEDRKSVV